MEFYEFEDCKNAEEYIKKYLNDGFSEDDIKESAYQYTYDQTNDWSKEMQDFEEINKSFRIGAYWMLKVISSLPKKEFKQLKNTLKYNII